MQDCNFIYRADDHSKILVGDIFIDEQGDTCTVQEVALSDDPQQTVYIDNWGNKHSFFDKVRWVKKQDTEGLVVITGVSTGIGHATARLFLEKGYKVVGITNEPCDIVHPNFTHYEVDIRDKEHLPDLGEVAYVINNAGTDKKGEAMDTNVYGMFNIEDKYITRATKSVVNLGSLTGHTGIEHREYTASKGAVLAYTKHLAKRVAPWGVRVNSISPGATITPINDFILKSDDPQLYEDVSNENLLKRWATPEEIAEMVYFVAVKATFSTASDFVCDGGEIYNHTYITPIKDYTTIV